MWQKTIFSGLYSDKTWWDFGQSGRAQSPIYIIKVNKYNKYQQIQYILIKLLLDQNLSVFITLAIAWFQTVKDSVRIAIHFFVNFDIFKWLYLCEN